ncbi:MAG: DUF1778 domain-containing protein [Endomicrobium sp.]|nr:DUF1778 domain-containing protein [Endomicrobium sp.]
MAISKKLDNDYQSDFNGQYTQDLLYSGRIPITQNEYDEIMKAILNPPKPNAAFIKAMQDYKKAISEGKITGRTL